MIRIYGITASRTARCLWMLEELGLEYEQIPVDHRLDEQKSPEYSALNPNQHIPTLVDGDVVLWESMAINLYLAEKYDGGLKPKTAEEWGKTYQWTLWAMSETEELLLTVLRHRFMFPEEQRKPGRADEAEAALQKPMKVLNDALDGSEYLVGDGFRVADLNLAKLFHGGKRGKLDLSAYSRIDRWLDACLSRPAHQRVEAKSGSSLAGLQYKKGWKFD